MKLKLLLTISSSEDSNSVMLISSKEICIPIQHTLELTKYWWLYLLYILDVVLPSYCHISKYEAFARLIHIDFNYRYGRSQSCHSQPLELCHKQFYRQVDLCLFTYRSIHVWKVLSFQTIYKTQHLEFVYGYYLGFHGFKPFTGVRAHPFFFACVVDLSLFNSNSLLSNHYLITKSTRHQGSIDTSISMNTTPCRHGSYEHCSHVRNIFRSCVTLIILLWFT